MIATDGRRTIANAPQKEPEQIPGQLTVEDCIRLAKGLDENVDWPPAEPLYGGHN